MKKMKNKFTLKIVLPLFLLSQTIVLANDDIGPIIDDMDPNPEDTPIDTPYFWALLLLLGAYVAYKKLQPKTT